MFKNFYEDNKEIIELSIKELVETWQYEKLFKDQHVGEPYFFHPSSLGKIGCLRKLQYKFFRYGFVDDVLNTVLDKDSKDMFRNVKEGSKRKRVFQNGNKVHERYAEYFDKMGILLENEREVRDIDKRIKGFIDDIVKINDKEYIIEMKSMNGISFDKLTKAKKEHEIQVALYMEITGIKDSFIVYENKNTQEIKEFHIKKGDISLEYVFSTIDEILEMSKKDELMPKKKERCITCPYSDLCKYDVKLSKILKNKINWGDFSEITTENK